ncbi:hypothetical protein WOLCODRAFT_99593 [Wolfiporia cocos MD-104 SS10]|uniref:Uncharacterized protein n=1 Tax=Wolfiporia cocos (strain MD-104) TaxID=742152 RepID=A0A2H3JGA9_WOLCO|nr:hypothetical protein WOLCODRAFT_99593 [Wolfiporia cocos MD-104 SS10]
MSYDQPKPVFDVPLFPEQDEQGGDDLPTYDDLAAQHGPNSRFGRWRQWIEKRAAERYADVTPEEYQRRRARGWGEGIDNPGHAPHTSSSVERGQALASPETQLNIHNAFSDPTWEQLPPGLQQLHINTDFSTSTLPVSPLGRTSGPSPPAALIPENVFPSHLKLYQFGSRFLPHATAPIRCLLPILNDEILLIGHDGGLSVLDMFPREWADEGLTEKGPADAEAKPIWEGEVVYQMSVLEAESTGQGTPQGVVLALVGPTADSATKEQEGMRTLRMYNLASLVSLGKWAIAQKGHRPLNLRAPFAAGKHQQNKKHGKQGSLTKGLKSLVIDAPIAQPQSPSDSLSEPQASYSALAEQPMYTKPLPPRPSERSDSVGSQSSWDVVDDLPLLWAAHYAPLASAGSRLHNTSVLFYELYQNETQRARGGALLAVATKSNILLYEAPKGERAFHLVKEFYTPLTARSITFVHQSVLEVMSRSSSDAAARPGSSSSQRHTRIVSLNMNAQRYSHQLSLFVVFDKKAGLIRIADSAVSEVDLFEESNGLTQLLTASNVGSPTINRKSRASWDGRAFAREHKGVWVPPVKFDIPASSNYSLARSMYILTRGKQSHIVPNPLPPSISAVPPYRILLWSFHPTHISCRVHLPSMDDVQGPPPFLQVIAFGEDGLEVQELPLSSLNEQHRKGKRREQDAVVAQSSSIGGDTGFLCTGGHWSQPLHPNLTRSDTMESYDSATSFESLSSETMAEKMQAHQGIYGWVRKGVEDFRVFWVGGTGAECDGENNEGDL